MYEGAAQPQLGNPGDILLGKYRVEEVIGVGGMGRVVRASHLYLQQPVAIKILLPNMAESQSTVARFLREAQATVRLRSEHIARVMDVGTLPDGTPFMVMEFLDGYDLNQILRHHGPQVAQAVVDLMLQACEGIAEAHAMGIVHRDIKPSNFFITRRPDGSSLLKILDFGISKAGDEISELTGTQTVIGTPTYMAPEQMQTARSTDPRSDIWSMGVVMYQMLAGRPPFEAEHYAQLVLKVATEPAAPLQVPLPGGLQSIVMRCLEKDPKNRLQTVGELARMLAPYASDPLSAQQSAERATRILTSPRGSQPGFPLGGTAGAGTPLTPPALTPKSWMQTGGSSLSAAAGQVGRSQKSGRGVIIGGVAALCIATGVGGFLLAKNGGGSSDPAAETHVTAPDTTPAPAAAPTTAPAPAPTPTPAVTPIAPTATTTTTTPTTPTPPPIPKAVPAPPPQPTPSTIPRTSTTAKVTTKAATSVTKATSPATKSTKATTAKTHKSSDDDLFDDRK
ncbi:MAG TPA: serine/threonine-protein kinase [Kofleriaceae bacterium]|nr:serine/threonine-protein kinase [Kofleriaceae bacterium]